MYIDFLKVTPAELERAFGDPEWAQAAIGGETVFELDPEPSGEVGKAWAGIEYLLGQADYSFEFLMEGDRILDEDMHCLDGWSPELVREVAERLEALPWERVAEHYDAEAMLAAEVYPPIWDEDEKEWLEEYYEQMRAFFKDAAASGAGAIMEFG